MVVRTEWFWAGGSFCRPDAGRFPGRTFGRRSCWRVIEDVRRRTSRLGPDRIRRSSCPRPQTLCLRSVRRSASAILESTPRRRGAHRLISCNATRMPTVRSAAPGCFRRAAEYANRVISSLCHGALPGPAHMLSQRFPRTRRLVGKPAFHPLPAVTIATQDSLGSHTRLKWKRR